MCTRYCAQAYCPLHRWTYLHITKPHLLHPLRVSLIRDLGHLFHFYSMSLQDTIDGRQTDTFNVLKCVMVLCNPLLNFFETDDVVFQHHVHDDLLLLFGENPTSSSWMRQFLNSAKKGKVYVRIWCQYLHENHFQAWRFYKVLHFAHRFAFLYVLTIEATVDLGISGCTRWPASLNVSPRFITWSIIVARISLDKVGARRLPLLVVAFPLPLLAFTLPRVFSCLQHQA